MDSPWLKRFPGLMLTLGITLLALQINRLPFPPFTIDAPNPHPIDTILIAIVLGMAVKNIFPLPLLFRDGIQFSTRGLLPLGIILLGSQLNFFHILRVSVGSLAISFTCVVVVLGLTYFLCSKASVQPKLGFLLGVGTAICGNTAIIIMSPIIEADENDTALSVGVVSLLGMVAVFVFPILGKLMDMGQSDFGVWVGVAVQATAQVVATGFSYGVEAGEIGTIVKLVRVLMLFPLTVLTTIFYGRYQHAHKQVYITRAVNWRNLIPPFILGFLLIALANTFHFFPPITFHLQDNFLWREGPFILLPVQFLSKTARFLITLAMAGIGFGIDLKNVRKTGLTPLWVGFFSAIILALLSLALIKLF